MERWEWEERNLVTCGSERRRLDWVLVDESVGEFGPEEVRESDEAARVERDDWGREVLGGEG
jgi:hypothetical protein